MHTADTVHTVEAKITTFAISTIFASFAKETLLQFEQFRQKKQKMQFVHCLLPKQKKQCLFLLITLIKLFAITIPAIAITATNKISIKQSS